VLQGLPAPKNRDELVERLSVLAFLQPDKQDHIAAAGDPAIPAGRPGLSRSARIDAPATTLCQRLRPGRCFH